MSGSKIIEFPGFNPSQKSDPSSGEDLAAVRALDRTAAVQTARWENRATSGRVRYSPPATFDRPQVSTMPASSPDRREDALGFLKLLSEIS